MNKNYVKEYNGHKVPEGATHAKEKDGGEVIFYRVGAPMVELYVEPLCSADDPWKSCLGTPASCDELPQEPESKEWDGEGLPPIGCECEVSFSNQAFESGVILFMGSEMAIINLNSTGYSEQHCHLNSTHFRPLKTQEQKDREAFIDAGIISYDNCEAKLFVDYVKLLLGKMFDDGFKAPEGE